jgi:hypothetical protein
VGIVRRALARRSQYGRSPKSKKICVDIFPLFFDSRKNNAFARADELGALRNRYATDGGNGSKAPFAIVTSISALPQ